jgi:uncharacterized ferredoxin-like protein
MAGKKKLDVVKLAILAVIVVSLILVIVGICIDWVSRSSTILNNTSSVGYALSDENLANVDSYGAMAAFAYITLALAIVCVLAYAASVVLNNKIVNYVTLAAGALLVVAAVVSLILSYTFCSNLLNVNWGSVATSSAAPAAGAWLVTVFGVVGGAATVVGGLKK